MEKRMDMCMCMTDSLCCTPETNTTLLVNYTPIKLKKKKANPEANHKGKKRKNIHASACFPHKRIWRSEAD